MKLNPILQEDYGVAVPKRLLDAMEDRNELADVILLLRCQKRGDVPPLLFDEAFASLRESARMVVKGFPDDVTPDARIDDVIPPKHRDWVLQRCCGGRHKNMASCAEYVVLGLLIAAYMLFLIYRFVQGQVAQGQAQNGDPGLWVFVVVFVPLVWFGARISCAIVRRRHLRLFGHIQTLGEVAHSALLWRIESFSNRYLLRDRIDKAPSVLDETAFSDLVEALHVLFAVPRDAITEETPLIDVIPKSSRRTYPSLLAETLGMRIPPARKLRRRTVGEAAEILLALNRGRYVEKTGVDPDNDVIQSLNWAFRFRRIRL